MYQKLYSTIAVFSLLFVLVSFLMSLSESLLLPLPDSALQRRLELWHSLGSGSGCSKSLGRS
jgi:hypothetical protein